VPALLVFLLRVALSGGCDEGAASTHSKMRE